MFVLFPGICVVAGDGVAQQTWSDPGTGWTALVSAFFEVCLERAGELRGRSMGPRWPPGTRSGESEPGGEGRGGPVRKLARESMPALRPRRLPAFWWLCSPRVATRVHAGIRTPLPRNSDRPRHPDRGWYRSGRLDSLAHPLTRRRTDTSDCPHLR
jgi:hypothetical protein